MIDDDKKAAAEAAADEVQSGMLVGLGTGSTAAYAIARIAARVREGLRIEVVATSHASARQAEAGGMMVRDFADVARVDLTIDGADEIDDRLVAIKGAGGAMLREKIVAAASDRMIVVADGSKRVIAVGAAKLPVEVLPFALAFVTRELEALGATPLVRQADDAPYRTDQDNVVIDCRFASFPDPVGFAAQLQAIPGVLGHGLFVDQVDAAYVAERGVVTRLERSALRR